MKRIIVIDDDQDIAALVRHRLTAIQMVVETYPDGEAGLAAILSNPPDLAIVDVMMPKLNGFDVVREMRASEVAKDLPVILFTGLGRPEEQQAGFAAGAEFYAVKPFSVLALGAYVQKILGLITCTVCGKARGPKDPDYSPEQELQRTEVGWTVSYDGEVCGDCRTTAFGERRLRIAT